MRTFRLTIVLAFAVLVSACQAPSPGAIESKQAAALPVWPQSPEEPRIRYVRSVSGPQDWGITKSFVRRFVDALAGRGAEHFLRPTGVAEREGVLYVADPGAQALWILDSRQERTIKVTEIGNAPLASPVAVAMRPDGAVYLADTGLKKVFLLDRNGKLLRIAAEEGLARPAGIAYDAASGRLYVVDSAAHRIGLFDEGGALLGTWSRAGVADGELNHPTHLALDREGTLLVTDALNFRIQAFGREGRFLWKLGRHGDGSGDFAAPKGVAADSEGNVYAVDALFDAVQIFARDGTLLLAFGERGVRPGQFWLPGGLFVSPEDRIYVADAYNQRIQVFDRARGAAKAGDR